MITNSAQMNSLVQSEVNRGARVEYQTSDSVTLSTGKPVRHILHLIVSLIIGPWSIVWAIFEWTGGQRREVIRLDANGAILREPVASSGNPMWAKVASLVVLGLWLILAFSAFA